MPLKGGRLTPQELRLAAAHAGGVEISEAARRAGYSHVQSAHNALRRPEVAAEVARVQRERLTREGLPLAVDALISIVSNDKQPGNTRVRAAQVILENTRQEDDKSAANVAELLPEALAAELARLREQEASLRQAIDVQVVEIKPSEVEPAGGVFD